MRKHHLPLALLALPVLLALFGYRGSASPAQASLPPPPLAVSSRFALSPPVPVDTRYRRSVEVEVAARIHLSRKTITSRLRATPGSTLMNLAKPLGLAEDQLGRIVLSSLNHAADTAVQSGRWTSRQAREEKRFWRSQSAASLIAEVSAWYVQG
jgi:hypothetical protein